MSYIADLDGFHYVLLAVLFVSMTITIAQFLMQPEIRALWADVRARLLINDLQQQDENRLRELGRMEGWTAQEKRPYPPTPQRWIDDHNALIESDRIRRNRRRAQ